jgi:hypothetical protein
MESQQMTITVSIIIALPVSSASCYPRKPSKNAAFVCMRTSSKKADGKIYADKLREHLLKIKVSIAT